MRLILFSIILLTGLHSFAQHRCGAHLIHHEYLAAHPEHARKYEAIEAYTRIYAANYQPDQLKSQRIVIPVVFHILYNNPGNLSENIPDLRVNEQIATLNNDFNATNPDTSLIPDAFKMLKSQLNVQFVLANRDPLGNPTNGIIRRQTNRTSFSLGSFTPEGQPMKFSSLGGSDAWDPRYYLNVWVCNLSGNVLGFASFPDLAGTPYDGIVLNARNTGSTGALSPFNRGRTGTHEVGHWLNLRHIWGDDGNACTGTDLVEDTPNQAGPSSGCPSFPATDACSPFPPGIMYMNYMDYTNDACMFMFSQGQAVRMQAILDGIRATLLESKGYIEPLNNNLAASSIIIPVNPQCNNTFIPEARFQNIGRNIIGTFTANFQIDDDPVVSKGWSGILNPGASVTIKFDEAITLDEGDYTIKFFSSAPNGSVDLDNSNDTIIRPFSAGNISIAALPVNEGFENPDFPIDGWIINNPDGKITWERTTKASSSGSASIYINNFDYDPVTLNTGYGQIDDLVSPFIDLSEVQGAQLRFRIAAAQFTDLQLSGNNWDTLQILISTDCGLSFTKVYEKSKQALVTTQLPTTVSFVPNSAQWRTENVNLSAFTGQEKVLIIFRNISHWENNIYLDDINIQRSTSTSTSILSLLDGMEIFPNPSSGKVTINIPVVPEGLVAIEWLNMMGQSILPPVRITGNNFLEHFNLSGKAPGLYIARFIFENGTHTAKKIMLK